MHPPDVSPAQPPPSDGPWWRELSRYHWFVLIVAALGWLFDTMDQQLFVIARTPALEALVGSKLSAADLDLYGKIATAVFILGWATGGLIFGLFSDRWGRARTMMLTILLYSAFTGLSALSVMVYDFLLWRFLTGMGVGGEFAAGVSLVAEVMPSRARPYALGLLQALSAIGNMTAAGISFLIPPQVKTGGVEGWRLMFLAGILPALLVVLVFRRLKEPDSWVKAKEAQNDKDAVQQQLGDLKELFRDPRWRYNTIIGVLLSVSGVLALWGVGFWTPELIRKNVLKGYSSAAQDWYASMASLLMNLGAFFGIYAFSLLTGYVGRRPAFALSYLLGWGATVLTFGFMTQPSQIWWMVPLLGFCTLMVFGGYAIYFPELYPTRLRSTGTGFCYNVARYLTAAALFALGPVAGWFTAPAESERAQQGLSSLTLLSSLGSVDNAFRYACILIASIFFLGLLVLPFAPETKGKPLPE